jgi:hypothetical protein
MVDCPGAGQHRRTIGIERLSAPPDHTETIVRPQAEALWWLGTAVRKKTFCKMLYESAARADTVRCPNVEDLRTADRRSQIDAREGLSRGSTGSSAPHSSCPASSPLSSRSATSRATSPALVRAAQDERPWFARFVRGVVVS